MSFYSQTVLSETSLLVLAVVAVALGAIGLLDIVRLLLRESKDDRRQISTVGIVARIQTVASALLLLSIGLYLLLR